MSSDAAKKRIDYLTNEISREKEEVSRYQAAGEQIDQDINTNLSVLIKDLETEITNITNELEEYQTLIKDGSKSRRTKANLENAIHKKEKEKSILEDMLNSYKKDLLFQITVSNAILKIVSKYNQNMDEKTKEIEELKHLQALDEVTKDYIEEEKDKEKLKNINEEIKQIKNRQKFDKTPDEIYDQIEMLLGSQNVVPESLESEPQSEEAIDEQIDDLFEEEKQEEPLLKVVEMIPAQTVQSERAGGTSYGA